MDHRVAMTQTIRCLLCMIPKAGVYSLGPPSPKMNFTGCEKKVFGTMHGFVGRFDY